MKGQIIKIISDLHIVSYNNEAIGCKCRGRFRMKKTIPQVGDYVIFDKERKLLKKFYLEKTHLKDHAFLI